MYINKNCLNDIISTICKCPVVQCALCSYMDKNTCVCGHSQFKIASETIEILKKYKDAGNLLLASFESDH